MIEILSLYENIIKDSDLDILVRLDNLFEYINYDTHQIEVTETVALSEHIDMEKGYKVIEIYNRHLEHLLNMTGIFFLDDDYYADFHFKADTLENIIMAEEQDNLDVLVSILDDFSDAEPQEFICRLLSAMTDKSFTYFETRILDADSSLVEKIKKLVPTAEFYVEVKENEKLIRDEFKKFIGDVKGAVYQIVIDASRLPLDYTATVASLLTVADDLPNSVLAREIYAAMIACGIPKESRRVTGNTMIGDLVDGNRIYDLAAAYEKVGEEYEEA